MFKISFTWQFLFSVWIIQGIGALIWLLMIPTDANSNLFLGFTTSRIILLAINLFLIIIPVILLFYERMALQSFFNIASYEKMWDFIYIISLFVFFVSPTILIVLYSIKSGDIYIPYAQRLTPLAVLFFFTSAELIGLISFFRYEQAKKVYQAFNFLKNKILYSFFVLSLFSLFITFTKIGITPDTNMGAPGIPVFEWQVIIVIFVLTLFLIVFRKKNILLDNSWFLPLIIYVFTLILWLSQPIHTAYTATAPRAPAFEIFPFSDPQIYAQYAQSALVGNGFLYPEIPSRPFYIAFLTWAHLLGMQNYNVVAIIQSFLLAFFPVILFFIGKEFGSRSLGIILALLIAFRDVNANDAVLFASNVSYSKLLLSEMPLALCISLITLITVRWLKNGTQNNWMPLLLGSLLGIATLIRTQSIGLLFVIVLFAYLVIINRKYFFKSILLLTFSLSLTLFPWLTRNYFAGGGILLDNTISQMMTMARRWNGSWGNEVFAKFESESEADYSKRMTQIAIEAFKRNPLFIIKTASNHFINSEIDSLMILPVRNEIHSLSELIKPTRLFWGALKSNQLPIFIFYMILFGVGVAITIHRYKWLGLFPLMLGLMYNAWTAIFFSSGERFIAPLDWSVLLYQVFGLIGIGALIMAFTSNVEKSASFWTTTWANAQDIFQPSSSFSRNKMVLICIFIFCMSVFTPLTEFIFPKKYDAIKAEAFIQNISIIPNTSETIIFGRALYPRYYEAGDSEPDTAKLGYGETDFSRLVFFVVGTENSLVIFELDSTPEFFPHASDVYLVGNMEEGYFSPSATYVSKDGKTALYQIP